MLVHLAVALLQVATPAPPQPPAIPTPERDSSTEEHRDKKPPKRIVVTGSHLATAYRDATARSILLLARDARMRQDSALVAYDATTYQRVSAGIGFRKLGRDRLAFRSEGATRVRWRRGVGAYVDVTGSRTVVPIAGKSGHVDIPGPIHSAILTGLEGAVSDVKGTAFNAFDGFPLDKWRVAGKTGTAQAPPKQDTALFVGFGPATNPQYVVAVVMEQSGFGATSAAPVARRLFGQLSGLETGPGAVQFVQANGAGD